MKLPDWLIRSTINIINTKIEKDTRRKKVLLVGLFWTREDRERGILDLSIGQKLKKIYVNDKHMKTNERWN